MTKNLLLIGAGQLGSRHLQALSLLNNDYSIYVIDPSQQSLDIAKQRYLDIKNSTSPCVKYFTRLDDLSGVDVNVCIIASSAAVRLDIIKQLIKQIPVEFLILEKVLFQSVSQLEQADLLLSESKVKTWVNCPRRQFHGYQQLAKQYSGAKSISIEVRGINWGLACNAIHFIDLWQYITGVNKYNIDFVDNVQIVESKRNGFKELTGELRAYSENKQHRLTLTCSNTNTETVELSITAIIDGQKLEISEEGGVIRWLNEQAIKEIDLKIQYQSQLTNMVVTDLIKSGNCELTPYYISSMLHSELLKKMEPFFAEQSSSGDKLIPIT